MNLPNSPVPLSGVSLMERLKLPRGDRSPEQLLDDVAVNSQVIQEFRPLACSLEWELSDLYWATEGVIPFARNDVPFIINNNGRASENAALVLFANCLEAPPNGDSIHVLELGAGTGLFARYFLSAFQAICRQENRSFYDRLLYFVSDRSQRTVQQWQEQQLFAQHGDHVVAGVCDGNQPSHVRGLKGEVIQVQSLRAIFANYVLDVMPSVVVRAGAAGPEELCVRTHLTNNHGLIPQYSDLTLGQVRELANAQNGAERAKLLSVLPLLEFESTFLPITDNPPLYLAEVLEFGQGLERVLLNSGAIECLEKCLELLHSDGFVILNDYGPIERNQVPSHTCVQRFGSSIALGINFPFLEFYFSRLGKVVMIPADNEGGIHARLISNRDLPHTRKAFMNRFASEALSYFDAPAEDARRHAAAGRNNEALDSYRLALQRSPHDWTLIGRAAEFAGLQLRNFQAALELIAAAIDLNPCYSTWLWNVLGDCLFCLERFADAHEAYLRAQGIDFDDVRTNYNLSYTYFQLGRYRESLQAIAHALSRDVQGVYRDRLLNKQQQVLAAISARDLSDRDRLAKRMAAFAG